MQVDVIRLVRALGIETVRRGRELWARCPYPGHENDDTPSWSILDDPNSDRHGLNHCFGCGGSGSALDLVTEVVGLSGYGAAISWLRERGLDVEESALIDVVLAVRVPRRSGAVRLPEPGGVRFQPLARWPGSIRRYVVEDRGLTAVQVDRWGIGYAVDGDLAGRVWIPTRDGAGRLLDWTARTYCDEDPRYRNPIDGGLAGAVFGESGWPAVEERRRSEVVVCEGAFDAMACERAGARYLAGLSGVSRYDRWTAQKIAGWGSVVVAVDPDSAGDRVFELFRYLARSSCSVRRVELPAGMDCDRLWRADPDRLVALLVDRQGVVAGGAV